MVPTKYFPGMHGDEQYFGCRVIYIRGNQSFSLAVEFQIMQRQVNLDSVLVWVVITVRSLEGKSASSLRLFFRCLALLVRGGK